MGDVQCSCFRKFIYYSICTPYLHHMEVVRLGRYENKMQQRLTPSNACILATASIYIYNRH